jgi:hypothetical protein
MQLSHLRPLIALPTFLLGVLLAWGAVSLWEHHVYAVNVVGKNLAEWAEHHDVTVMINGKPVNKRESFGSVLTMTRGCVDIYRPMFYEAKATGPYTPEWKNLSAAIRKNGGRALKLPHRDKMENTTPEQLAEDLRPLGQLEFVSVYKTGGEVNN